MASDAYLGEILIVPFNFAPKGWAFCNGQLLPIQQNQALFSLLGTSYGGNGISTFALPDFRGRAPIHISQNYRAGDQPGTFTNTLNASQLPVHTHTLKGNIILPTGTTATSSSPIGKVPVSDAVPTFSSYVDEQMKALTPADLGITPANTTSNGGGQPYNNMMPFLVLNYIIAIQGIFPSLS